MMSDPVHPSFYIAHHNGLREADLARMLLGEAYRRKADRLLPRAQGKISPPTGRRDGARLSAA